MFNFFSGVAGSPVLACANAAVGVVGDTSGSATVLILTLVDGVEVNCVGINTLYSFYYTPAMDVTPTLF